MHITKTIILNYRCLREAMVDFDPQLNTIVGDNEGGKSTLLEAINLALSGQLNGRSLLTELHPHLFHEGATSEWIYALREGESKPPPTILIEVYFNDDATLSKLKGIANTLRADVPGIRLEIKFNSDFSEELAAHVEDPSTVRSVPVEYYTATWRSFADNDIAPRAVPLKPSFIDASVIRNNAAAGRYIIDVLKNSLTKKQQVDLALSYRVMKDDFLQDDRIRDINKQLETKKGVISDKVLSVALDSSARALWETSVTPHLDELPLTQAGKGEQNSVKIKLALEGSSRSHVVLIEEPENHLSYSRLNELISHLAKQRGDRQLLITTHSSFVLNKLGLESLLLFDRGRSATLNKLDAETRNYFLKLPGHDTLRLVLCRRAILVEGPSDELIVQRAFEMTHGKTPLAAGVDVITVNSLAFKRFLEVAVLLKRRVDVVTDNDGDCTALKAKYESFEGQAHIQIHYDHDESRRTLEPQLVKANGLQATNSILGTAYTDESKLLDYMGKNKTDCALKFFATQTPWVIPPYIRRAVS